MLTDEGIEPCTTSSGSRTSIRYVSYAREVHKTMERADHGGRNIRGKAARSSASLVRMSERVVSRHQATDASLFRMSLPTRAGPLPMSLSSSGHILGVVEQERTTCSTSPKRVAEAVRLTFWKTLRCSGWSSLRRHRTSAQIAADVTCFGLAEDRPRSPREHDGNA